MPGAAGSLEKDVDEKKINYVKKLHQLLTTYTKVITVHVDMVTSNQIQKVRKALRGKAELLMGKNVLDSFLSLLLV
jgi:large subunit ribosomal protein LP0